MQKKQKNTFSSDVIVTLGQGPIPTYHCETKPSWVWWQTLEVWKQEDLKFRASMSYQRSYLNTKHVSRQKVIARETHIIIISSSIISIISISSISSISILMP